MNADINPALIAHDLQIRFLRLKRLTRILNFELYTIVLYLLQYMWKFTIFLAILAAVLFTPYMIFVLVNEKKYGWIIFFIILVIFPLLIIVLFLSDHLFYLAYLLIPLPLFYLYCFLLRADADEWRNEMNWKIYNETQQSKPKSDNDFITLR